MYKLFRLEFVRNYLKPLSSDGFSSIGKDSYKEHADEIREAYAYLLSIGNKNKKNQRPFLSSLIFGFLVIPKSAQRLDDFFESRNVSLMDQANTLFYELHRDGVNLRHLGRVRRFMTRRSARDLVLVECIARTAKCHLRALLRTISRNSGIPTDDPYRQITLQFLNMLIGKSPYSKTYWNNHLKVN